MTGLGRRLQKASTQQGAGGSAAPITGMYMGWGATADITAYEAANSIDIPYGHEFGDQTQWSWFENGTNFSQWNTWVGAKPGRRFTYSAPLLTAGDDTGLTIHQKYTNLAAGSYNSHFANLGNAFQSQPNLRNAIVRLGWEFNGNSRAWAVPPNNQTTLNNYKAGFNQAASALKAACPTLEIEWCPNCQLDYTNRVFVDMYPGNTYVDYIGIGLYDYYWPGGNPSQAQREAWLRDSTNGLADQVALAAANSKRLAHTEWGLWESSSTGGGGDRPAFIDFMADWYEQHDYVYHIYNNIEADAEHRLDLYPNAKARYLARFR